MKQNGAQAVMVARCSAVTASPALRSRFSAGLVPAKLGSASSSQTFLPGFTNRGQVSTPSGLAWGGGTALAGCIPPCPSTLHKSCCWCKIGQKASRACSLVQNNLGKQGLLSICIFLLQREGSKQAPIAGGSIQTCHKGAVCALKSFWLVAFRCWVLRSQGVASGSPTKPPSAARD